MKKLPFSKESFLDRCFNNHNGRYKLFPSIPSIGLGKLARYCREESKTTRQRKIEGVIRP